MFSSTKVRYLGAGVLSALLMTGAAEAGSKKGSFRGQTGHSVTGTATLTSGGKLTLSGFRSQRGPDLYVYVGNGSPRTRIAKLKRTSGTQTYTVPASIAKSAKSVHIYCKKFSVGFGVANLR